VFLAKSDIFRVFFGFLWSFIVIFCSEGRNLKILKKLLQLCKNVEIILQIVGSFKIFD